MSQADLPSTFNRFWRISLSDHGYRDEIVEFLGYLPDGRCHIRYVRGRVDDACSPYSLFPIEGPVQFELL